ncbi:lissencephaly-1 [Biomphalaria glabrata]|nr:putative Biomphalaria glabrata lissencephaly-1 [Biomphalaria glabrata]
MFSYETAQLAWQRTATQEISIGSSPDKCGRGCPYLEALNGMYITFDSSAHPSMFSCMVQRCINHVFCCIGVNIFLYFLHIIKLIVRIGNIQSQ